MGTQHKTSITINGKRYDAKTGKPLPQSAGGAPKTAARASTIQDVHRAPSAHHQVHRPAERSKTLMRHAVKQPAKPVPKHHSSSALSGHDRPVQKANQPLSLLYHPHETERQKRAQKIKQSTLVSRFSGLPGSGSAGAQPVTKKVQELAVHPAPAIEAVPIQATRVSSAAEKLIAKGLKSARSHTAKSQKQTRKKSKRGRLASLGAGSLAVLLLGTFIAYQNVPNITLRYAATKAGVSAQLPGYRPSGFSLSNRIQYNPGQVTLNFTSNSDDRKYSITQRSSPWDSETLRSSYVASVSDQVQTFEDKGRTIYLYGDSNATWVNGGIWYELNGHSKLNSDQLIRIATSL